MARLSLIPQKREFYDLFNQAAANAVRCAVARTAARSFGVRALAMSWRSGLAASTAGI